MKYNFIAPLFEFSTDKIAVCITEQYHYDRLVKSSGNIKLLLSIVIVIGLAKVAKNVFFLFALMKSFKVKISPSKKICFICFDESPLKIMKNAFYFILKALFVVKIFKFLSRCLSHVEKIA